ncbi:MAG: 2-C-methyl-D-erythritol 2,4-cyclodiphosphate synthase [candidate division Zixibacteria bacterium]|nr:2-C-methyl-D-erythritol 2,4-cyclodiphosphate synthase [candidate division Zixibacteria bacterium]
MVKTGIGFDAHRLVEDRKLILGGVKIDYERGLLGHSDADVVCHAIADALLGAAGLGDIGMMFPDTNAANKDISSLKILSAIRTQIEARFYYIINIDISIIAEEPKIGPYIERMKKAISESLSISTDAINLKGKTTETLGFTGRKEGIAALAVATIEQHEL